MLTLRTLGELALEHGDEAIGGSGSQRRPLAILAVLAAAGDKGVGRERLETLFWPDSDPERAKGTLKQSLYSLRRDAKSPELILGTSHLRLNPEIITSDLSQFLDALSEGRVQDAVLIYRGPFMEGIEFPRLDELDRLVWQEREALAKKYKSAAESLANAREAEGDHTGAINLWAELARKDPYSSHIALRYLKALAATGERERAIKHGSIYERLLQNELGARLTPEISALIANLKEASHGAPTPPLLTTEINAAHEMKPGSLGVAGVDVEPSARGSSQDDVRSAETITAKGPRRSRLLFRSVLVAVAFAVAGFLTIRRAGESSSGIGSAEESNRVVILPFENRTGDTTLNVLGPMAAEWVTDGLSHSAVVPVTDPGTAAAAVAALRRMNGGRGYTIARIAKATGAQYVVTGSFYLRGDSLEFHARAVDGTSGRVLGAIRPVRVPSEESRAGIGLLRSQVLSLLAQLFDARLAQVTMPDLPPPAFESYREFVAGVDLMASRAEDAVSDTGRHDPHNTAREHFRRAYARDTTFVTPLVWVLFTLTEDDEAETRLLLDSLRRRRERLSPLDRNAVDYFSANMNSDAAGALRAAQAASDLAPRSEWSWIAGRTILPRNRPREAMKYFTRLDPDAGWMRLGWPYYWYLTAQTSHMLGDLEQTHLWLIRARKKFPEDVPIAAAYARSLALNGQPDSMVAIVREILQSSVDWRAFYVYSIIEDLRRHHADRDASRAFRELAAWYESQGAVATEPDRREFSRALFSMNLDVAAAEHFRKLLSYFPGSTWRTHYTGHLAVLEAKAGESVSATRLIESVPKEKEQWPGENSYWRARVTAQVGHKAEAVALLRRAFDEGYPQISISHSMWYDFPTLHRYPPFEALVASDR